MSKLVLVCGSRSWERADIVRERLKSLPLGTEIVHGGARGADQIAASIARALGIPERAEVPDWPLHGRRAGVLRNLKMLDAEPALVIAFWDGRSTGTEHTISEANRRGIPVEVVLAA